MNHNDKVYTDNLDPISGEPGSHPMGTGIGAASGGIAGAAIGAVGGPIGIVAGAVFGAIAGGVAGKSAAESANPTAEDAYWRDQYPHESYFTSSRSYQDFAAAYRLGSEAHERYPGKSFEEIEAELEREYNASREDSTVDWNEAKSASRAAWNRTAAGLPRYAGTL